MIDLAVISGQGFLEPIGVLLHSILRWHPAAALRIHWVHLRLDRAALAERQAICRDAGLAVSFLAGDQLLADAGWPADAHPALLKIFLPDLLAHVGPRLLYLDGDTVVEGPLWPLWQLDLGDAAIGGVRDSWVGSERFWSTPPISSGVSRLLWTRPDYVNAGVLLFDVERCRTSRLAERCLQWLGEHPGAHFFDQDALNAVLAGAIALAAPAWNVLGSAGVYLGRSQPHWPYSAEAGREAYCNPQIIHFAGQQKPWLDPSRWSALAPRYIRARRHTPWHRDLSLTERLHLATMDLAYRLQCRQQIGAAGAILRVRHAALRVSARIR